MEVSSSAYAPASGTAGTFTIDFDGNGGTCKTGSVTGFATTWGNAPKGGDCTRDGYWFKGYNTSANGTGTWIYPQGNINFTGDNRVYAIWTDPANLKAAGAPTNVIATTGWNKITVAWAPPADPGDFPITNYLATSDPGRKSCVTTVVSYDSSRPASDNPLECAFTNLTPGVKYTFQVQALNGVGWGELSAASNITAPQNLKITKYDRKKGNLFDLFRTTVSVDGVSPGFPAGTTLTPWVKVGSGQFVAEPSIKTNGSEKFSWSKKFAKKHEKAAILVKFAVGANESNTVNTGVAQAPAPVRAITITVTKKRGGDPLVGTYTIKGDAVNFDQENALMQVMVKHGKKPWRQVSSPQEFRRLVPGRFTVEVTEPLNSKGEKLTFMLRTVASNVRSNEVVL